MKTVSKKSSSETQSVDKTFANRTRTQSRSIVWINFRMESERQRGFVTFIFHQRAFNGLVISMFAVKHVALLFTYEYPKYKQYMSYCANFWKSTSM